MPISYGLKAACGSSNSGSGFVAGGRPICSWASMMIMAASRSLGSGTRETGHRLPDGFSTGVLEEKLFERRGSGVSASERLQYL
jgi:hypothetical protein